MVVGAGGMPLVGAQVALTGTAAFNAAVAGVVRSFGSLGTAANSAGQVMSSAFNNAAVSVSKSMTIVAGATFAGVSALASLSTVAAVQGAKFQQMGTYVQVTANETNAATKQIQSYIVDMARSGVMNIEQLNKGLLTFIQTGAKYSDVFAGAFKQAYYLSIASAGELDFEKSIRLVTGAMNIYGIKAEDSARITNTLVGATNLSIVSYNDMYQAWTQMAQTSEMMGISIEDGAAALSLMGNRFLRGSDAGTSFKQMILKLLAPSKQAVESMKAFGITLWDAQGRALPLIEIIDQLHKAFGGLNPELEETALLEMKQGKALADVFGARAIRPAVILANIDPKQFAELKGQIAQFNAQDMAGKMIKPAASQFEVLENNAKAVFVVIGSQLEPALRAVLTTINGIVASVSESQIAFFGKALAFLLTGIDYSSLRNMTGIFGGDFGRVLLSVVDFLKTIHDVVVNQVLPSIVLLFNTLTKGDAVKSFSDFFTALSDGVTFIGNAIEFISKALSALISALQSTTAGSLALRAVFIGLLALPFVSLVGIVIAIGVAFSGVIIPILAVSAAIGAIVVIVQNWDLVSKAAITAITGYLNLLIAPITLISGAITQLITNFTPALSALGEIITIIFNEVVTIATAIVNALGAAFGAVGSVVSLVFGTIGKIVIDALSGIAQFIGSWVQFVIDNFNVFLDAIDAINPAMGKLVKWIYGAIVDVIKFFGSFVKAGEGAANSFNEAWSGISGFIGKVLNWVADKISTFINWLAKQPVIGKFVEGLSSGLALTEGQISATVVKVQDDFNGLITGATNTFDDFVTKIKAKLPGLEGIQKAIDDIFKAGGNQEDIAKNIQKVIDDAMARLKAGQQAGTAFPEAGGGGKESKEDELKRLTAEFLVLLHTLPGINQDMAEYLAKLEQETPGRMGAIVGALMGQRDLLQQMVDLRQQSLQTDMALLQVEQQLAMTNAQIAVLNAQKAVIDAQYNKVIVGLQNQQLQLERQMAPIKSQIRAIDEQITKLQREDLDIALAKAKLEVELIPYKAKQLEIDYQLAQLAKKNYDLIIAQNTATLNALPYRQQIARLEQQIANIADQRLAQQEKEQQLFAQRNVDLLDRQLKSANKQLDEAWASMNVPQILQLQAQIDSLTAQQTTAQDNLDNINNQIADTQFSNDVAALGYQAQIAALNELLKPLDVYLLNLQQQADLEAAINALSTARLEQQKQALADITDPIQHQIDLLTAQAAAQAAVNELTIIPLQQQKQALEDVLAPLQAQYDAIGEIINQLNIQKGIEEAFINEQLADYQLIAAQEGLRRADLELTKLTQDMQLQDLIIQFADALKASKAFSTEEALEVAKRMKLWNDQIQKWNDTVVAMQSVTKEANSIREAIDSIKDKTVTITTVHRDVYEGTPSLAAGGTVPGPAGSPQLVIAHGGERFLGIGRSTPARVQAANRTGNNTSYARTVNNNFNPTVNANYASVQRPDTIRMDLNALVARSRR